MRRFWIIGAIVAQIALLAIMAGEREWIVRSGRTVQLRTAPRDPNDPMRGRYVHLEFPLNRVSRELCRDGLPAWFDEKSSHRSVRDRRVYAVLTLAPDGLAEFVSLTDRKPSTGVFLAGRANHISGDEIYVRYGVEALFLQQEKAAKLEADTSRQGEMAGVPLNVDVAVSPKGVGVLKGYQWEPFGINLTFERASDPSGDSSQRRAEQTLKAITVEVKNFGKEPRAIAVRPNAGSFRLVPIARWSGGVLRWDAVEFAKDAGRAPEVRVLAPGETYRERIEIDGLSRLVRRAPVKSGVDDFAGAEIRLEADVQSWFRIEYVAPTLEEARGLPNEALLWHRSLPSRAFTFAGGRD